MIRNRPLVNIAKKLANQSLLRIAPNHIANKPNLVKGVSLFQTRLFSETNSLAKVHFKELRSCQKDKHTVIIDVREPNELAEHGVIEGSINIPLGEVEHALKTLPNEEFLRKYGRTKPEEGSPIIFTCQRGIRSEKAQIMAQKLGYTNVKNYIGGWLDWAENIKTS